MATVLRTVPRAGWVLVPGTLGLLCILGPAAAAAPTQIRLSLLGDGTSVGVAWNTLSGTAGATVEYGTAKGSYTKSATAKTTALGTTLGTQSEAELTGLSADTTYYYRVGSSAAGWSSEGSFRTGPTEHAQCGKVRFAVIGDSRAESWEGDKGVSTTFPKLLALALAHQVGFVAHGGDIVYDGQRPQQWLNHLTASAPYSAAVPLLYALGNHDNGPGEGEGANFNKVLLQPRASTSLGGSGTEDYYFFTFGNAIVVVLSTVSYSSGSPKFQTQADWMDKVLAQNPKRWKLAVLHHPIYTEDIFINHKPNEVGQNAALVPVFNKHHVDIVFQGHNHYYERWVPSACTSGASTKVCPVASYDKGTVYITTGGGGAFPIVWPGLTSATRPAASGAHHYLLLDIVDHKLSLTAYDSGDKTIDTLAISKTPGTPDPCVGLQLDGGQLDGGQLDGAPVSPRESGRDAAPARSDGAGARDGAASDGASPVGEDACSCVLGARPGASSGALLLVLLLLALSWKLRRARRARRT